MSESDDLTKVLNLEFRAAIPEIFGNTLMTAFIFGGFGKGYGGPGHDVDMFVLVSTAQRDSSTQFRSWYFGLHDRLGLPPDVAYPGEIVDYADINQRIATLEQRSLRAVIETQYEYEAILWADALIERKLALLRGPAMTQPELDTLFSRAAALNRRWREEIRKIRPEPPEVLASLDLRRLFKGHIKYLKQ